MENQTIIETGYGLAKGDDAFAVGVEAARQALSGIREHAPSLVLVFASICYDLEELLSGVHSLVGNVPVAGATTGGGDLQRPSR